MTEYGNGGGYTVTMDGPFGGGGGGSSSEKMISIHAPVSNWKGATSPYSQIVEVYGLNIGSKVDIQISTQLLEQLSQQRIWFTAENRGGVVTLFAVGDKPAIDCEFQATLSDVVNITGEDIETIRGNTVSTVIPQGDFAQKDPNKSDFIRNKPSPFVVSNEKPEGAAIWFNKKENLDDPTIDAHIMAHDLNMAQHQLYGVPTPTANDQAANKGYVNAQVKKAAPRNLLANSDFANTVDQRGHGSYSGTVYGADRWYGRAAAQTVSVRTTDITVSATGTAWVGIKQRVERIATYAGRTLTLAVNVYSTKPVSVGFHNDVSDSTLKETVDSTAGTRKIICTFKIPDNATTDTVIPQLLLRTSAVNDYMRIYWAALYEGEYTLDTLPEYQHKGYSAELAECQNFFRRMQNNKEIVPAHIDSATTKLLITIPYGMRKTDNLRVTGYGTCSVFYSGGVVNTTITSVESAVSAGNAVCLEVVTAAGPQVNTFSSVNFRPNTNIDFSADL
jgi:hypothetical protein